MAVTVGVNGLSVVHKDSGGVTAAFPDVCLTPSGAGPIPISYPNIAQSADTAQGTQKVFCDGNSVCLKTSNFSTSVGDEGGTAGGGVASGTIKEKAEFVSFSFDVKFEGKNFGFTSYFSRFAAPTVPFVARGYPDANSRLQLRFSQCIRSVTVRSARLVLVSKSKFSRREFSVTSRLFPSLVADFSS